jgi:hypothetical protein
MCSSDYLALVPGAKCFLLDVLVVEATLCQEELSVADVKSTGDRMLTLTGTPSVLTLLVSVEGLLTAED